MISGDVVLVDGLLHEAHPEHICIKGVIATSMCGDRCEMVDTMELHDDTLYHMHEIADGFALIMHSPLVLDLPGDSRTKDESAHVIFIASLSYALTAMEIAPEPATSHTIS